MQMTTFETNKLSIVSCLMWVVMDNAKNGSCCYSPSTPSSGERASEMCCQIDEQQYAVVANRGTENESETRRRIFGFVSYHTGSHSLNENSKMYHTRRRRQNVKNYHKKWLCWEINGLYERICVCVCTHHSSYSSNYPPTKKPTFSPRSYNTRREEKSIFCFCRFISKPPVTLSLLPWPFLCTSTVSCFYYLIEIRIALRKYRNTRLSDDSYNIVFINHNNNTRINNDYLFHISNIKINFVSNELYI